VPRTAAVFFDVDFTLIHPGPRFQGVGYRESCARYGIDVSLDRFEAAVAGASGLLHSEDHLYDDGVFVRYTQRIIELMGGAGPDVETVAREIYDDWAEHRHFELYDDVPDALKSLQESGIRLGLISNSHRPLRSFDAHFGLKGLIAVTISSFDHGFMKPHPSIFEAALREMRVPAGQAVMVGDSLAHDVLGARQVGMDSVLLARNGCDEIPDKTVPVIRTLGELPDLLASR
jgi:HAD superfamily hydrolase (TIGR01662 family)